MLFWWDGEKIQGKAGYWAVYATFYKALIMQKADPAQQSSNRPYCSLGFFVSASIGWSIAEFSVIGGWRWRKGSPFRATSQWEARTWEPGRVCPHIVLTLWLTLGMSVRKKNHPSFAVQIKRSEVVFCLLVYLPLGSFHSSKPVPNFEEIFSNYYDLIGLLWPIPQGK